MTRKKEMPRITCAILAGGLSRRMGVDKAFLPVAGRPMIEWVLRRLEGMGAENLIVTISPHRFQSLGARIVTDVLPGYGSLGGLYTALYYATFDRVLVVGCDMPFLSRELLRYQILLSSDFDIVVPRIGHFFEPLHAVYSKRCTELIFPKMQAGEQRIFSFYPEARVRYVERAEIEMFDPQHLSFINFNTPEDLDKLEDLVIHLEADRESEGEVTLKGMSGLSWEDS